MARGADFHLDPSGQLAGNAEPGAKYFENQRVASANQLHATTYADTQCFKPLRVFIIGGYAAHDGADPGWKFVQPH